MKKYLEIGKINFLNNITYFRDFVFKAVFILIILFIFVNLWKTIYGTGNQVIEGFTISMMVWYLLIAEAIVSSESHVTEEVNKEVQSGEIANVLNKPYSYTLFHLSRSLAYRLLSFSVIFVLGAILVYFMIGGIDFSFIFSPFCILVILLALVLDTLVYFWLGLLSFWFEDTTGFVWIYSKIVFTIGGMLVPLEIFPDWLEAISRVLPFSFVAYHPARLFVNFNMDSFFQVVLYQIGYIFLIGVIVWLTYRSAVRRLNINGG